MIVQLLDTVKASQIKLHLVNMLVMTLFTLDYMHKCT